MKTNHTVKITGMAVVLAVLLSGCVVDGMGLDAVRVITPDGAGSVRDDHAAAPAERRDEGAEEDHHHHHDNGRHRGEHKDDGED